jgi:hypothetical protein
VLPIVMSIWDLPLSTQSAHADIIESWNLRKPLVEFHHLLVVVQKLGKGVLHLLSPY